MTGVRDGYTNPSGQTEIESDRKSFLAPGMINVMKKTHSREIKHPSQEKKTQIH